MATWGQRCFLCDDKVARSNIVKLKVEGFNQVPETRRAQQRDEYTIVQFKDTRPYSWEEFTRDYNESDDDESGPSNIVFYSPNSTVVYNALHEHRLQTER